MVDVVIVNGTVVDGTGAAPFPATVLVEGGRLRVERGDVDRRPEAPRSSTRRGRVVAPGIVDLHTHSDVSNLSEPHAISAIEQGVTTQVVGLCGFSAGAGRRTTRSRRWSTRSRSSASPASTGRGGRSATTSTTVDRVGIATNTVTLVGHNNAPPPVMGGEQRGPSADELRRMQDLLREAIARGRPGLLDGPLLRAGHLRHDRRTDGAHVGRRRGGHGRTTRTCATTSRRVRASLAEAIATAERSGVELNISHLYPRPSDPADEADRLIEMIEAARARGRSRDLGHDGVPARRRRVGAVPAALGARRRHGGDAGATPRSRTSDAGSASSSTATPSSPGPNKWDDQLIVKVNRPEARALIGRTIGEIATERGTDPLDTALDLVIEEGQYWVAPVIKRQPDLDRLLSHPLGVPVTDGMASHPVKHRDLGIMPKTFGSFPQILGRYVRDAGVMPLEHAIHQMTQVPAERVAITDRGVLRDGLAADLVIFDPATIANRATESGDPAARPAGIDRVMVNGRWVVVGGARDRRPGGTRALGRIEPERDVRPPGRRRRGRRRDRAAARSAPTSGSRAGASSRSATWRARAVGRREVVEASGRVVAPGFIDVHVHSEIALLTEIARRDRRHPAGRHDAPHRPGRVRVRAACRAGPRARSRSSLRFVHGPRGPDAGLADAGVLPARLRGPHPAQRRRAGAASADPRRGHGLGGARRDGRRDRPRCAPPSTPGCRPAPSASTAVSTTSRRSHSDTRELVALARVAAAHGGIYTAHGRNHARSDATGQFHETVQVGREAGLPVHVFARARRRRDGRAAGEWREPGLISPRIRICTRRARRTSCTTCRREDTDRRTGGGPRAADVGPAYRAALMPRLEAPLADAPVAAERVVLGDTIRPPHRPQRRPTSPPKRGTIAGETMVGRSCARSCPTRSWSTRGAPRRPSSDRSSRARSPSARSIVSSDGLYHGERPHPRGYGTFPRAIRVGVRELGAVTLEGAVHRMTGKPADALPARRSRRDRGRSGGGPRRVRPDTFADRATYAEPRLTPVGLDEVIVNGVRGRRAGNA